MIVNGQYYIPQSDDDSPELNSSVNTTQNTLEDFTSHQKQVNYFDYIIVRQDV